MAKKSDVAYEKFLADLKAINPKIEEILTDEKTSTLLRDGVLAKSEFSSQMDTLRAEREKFEGEVIEAKERIAGWQKWYGDTSQVVAATQDELKKYKEAYGDLSEDEKARAARQVGLSAAEFDKRFSEKAQERDVAAMKFADMLTDLKMEHRDRFKEKLDTEELYKIAGERQLPLDVAYSVYTADKVEAQLKEQHKMDIEKAKEEAVRDFQSKHNLPVLNSNSDLTSMHVLDVQNAPKTSADRVAAAVARFNARGQ